MKNFLPILFLLIISSCSTKETTLNFLCDSETVSGQHTLRINMQNKTMHFISASAMQGNMGITFSKSFTDGEDLITASLGDADSSLESLSFNKFSGVAYENFTWGSIKYQCKKIKSLI